MYNLRKSSQILINNLNVKISNLELKNAWQQSQKHSNAITKRNAYNNYLCYQGFLKYLKTEFGDYITQQNTSKFDNSFQVDKTENNENYEVINAVIPDDKFLSSIWEVVNGTPIELNETRLIIIPSEKNDYKEFLIPQEWVDIPNWNADYYLFAEIDEDEDENDEVWIRFLCFATHSLIKKKAKYNEAERNYLLSLENVCDDFNIFWLSKGMNFNKEVKALPKVSLEKAEKLINLLSNPLISHPRLAINFQEWAALLTENQWRETLYNQRFKVHSLREWLAIKEENLVNLVRKGWQNTEDFFNSLTLDSLEFQPVRDFNCFDEIVKLVQPNQPPLIRSQAVGVLGAIGNNNTNLDVVNILTNLIDTDYDEDIRYQAGLSLRKLMPNHPKASISNTRLIDLGFKIQGYKIALVITIIPKEDDVLGIWVQVQTADKAKKLPPGLKLSILSEFEEVKMEVEARIDEQNRGKDDVIQKRFTLPIYTHFKVKVSLEDVSFIEDFMT